MIYRYICATFAGELCHAFHLDTDGFVAELRETDSALAESPEEHVDLGKVG